MNGNWGKVILFSILFCILGFILGRVTCGDCRGGSCDRDGMRGDACMMHGGMMGGGMKGDCDMKGMRGDCDMHGKKDKCCDMKGDSANVGMMKGRMMRGDSASAK
jgi:hypothetical protein